MGFLLHSMGYIPISVETTDYVAMLGISNTVVELPEIVL